MIGKLKGIIDSIEEKTLLLDVSGVCYLVYSSANTLRSLPSEGEATSLLIETHVREDHIHLYGFATSQEKEWFNILTTVKGVGNKMGLAILSSLPPEQISSALIAQDKTAFTQVSGVGPKLADRILTELKDKGGTISGGDIKSTANIQGSNITTQAGNINNDAISALANLGYSRSDAYNIVVQITQDDESISVEELIRKSLKELALA